MPAWPGTLEQLREAGYQYEERGKCLAPSCQVEVFWFLTPRGKWMPFEQLAVSGSGDHAIHKYQPHFATCPDARKFSRKSKEQVVSRGV